MGNKIFFKGIIFAIAAAAFSIPLAGSADTEINLTVSPSLIDIPACEKGRICLEEPITIRNNSAVKASVYSLINDISETGVVDYSDPGELPKDASIAYWTDFYRSKIEIMPGETATQTLKITASPNALPGQYHAQIVFSYGSNLPQAQAAAEKLNLAKLALNLAIKDHKVEQAEINLFKQAKAFFTSQPIGFLLKIKNIGNTPISPAGEIVIYNKSGKEIGSIPLAAKSVAPDEIKDFSAAGNLKLGPGKYKAKLFVSYGEANKDLSDLVYFSYLPIGILAAGIIIALALAGGGALLIGRKRQKRKNEARASGIKDEEEEQEQEEAPPRKMTNHKKYVINLKR